MADFDEFLDSRVQPGDRAIVLRFCDQMTEFAPDAVRRMRGGTEKYYSVPVFRLAKDIVAISPTKSGITFSFTQGASFSDPFSLLGGTGKRSRTVRVSSIEHYPEKAMAHYIRQAIDHG